jgi:glycosyltransferase involved in cell wall biosynthesis
MKPFYHLAPQIWRERAQYAFVPLWEQWVRRQLARPDCPKFDAVQVIMGFGSALFPVAAARGALKIVDCPNSHPTSYYGYWQRECDLWCPGEQVPIPRWMYARMNRDLEAADVVLCPSDFVRDTMILNGVPAAKCVVNPFGVNTNVFRPRETVPPAPRFVCVGTICLRKGHQYLFRAFERLKQIHPRAELVCVGEYKCDFRKERPRWEGSFVHHERLTHPELAKLLQSASAFVLASVEEGFARVLSEAMGAALPIIATYETGARTIVRDGVEGFIVPSRNPVALADAMDKIISDPDLNLRMGQSAHQKGAVANTWQDYSRRLLEEYARHKANR